jgi:agmatinase
MSDLPTYAVPAATFLGIRAINRDAELCIAGIPHDIGTTNRSGARFGPVAVRQASRMLIDGAHPSHWVDPTSLMIADIGDFRLPLGDIPGTLEAIERQARDVRHLIAIGGDHSISLPLLRALSSRLGPVGLIHFDAHVDTWPNSFGQTYGHSSPFFHAINEGLVDPHRMIQVGIRSPVHRNVYDWTVERGVTIVPAASVHEQGPAEVARRIVHCVGAGATYLSFDIDALDPAFAPGTGTPEIGGLSSWQAREILRRLATVRLVGMDLTEVSPPYDVAEITSLAAATFIWEYLALIGCDHRPPAAVA